MDLIGQSIGRYHIVEQIGEGGMASVFKAYDTRLEREVAIKVIRKGAFPPDSLDRLLQRFELEAKAMARLSHNNIIKIHDYGEYEGSPYLIMEYIPAGTLKQRMGQPIPWQEAIKIIIPIAQALAYAHKHEVIHRDIKPANILMNLQNQPMLTDFGIAKMLEGEDGHTLTGTGVGIGTPEYMAPEQGLGKRDIDGRADIYSLGIVFYELITGRKPYTADTPLAVVIKQINASLPNPKKFVPNLPTAVEKVIYKVLAKDPDNRYQNADEFIQALENINTVKSAQTKRKSDTESETIDDLFGPTPPPKNLRTFLQSLNPIVKWILLGLLCIIAVAGGYLLIQRDRNNEVIAPATTQPINIQATVTSVEANRTMNSFPINVTIIEDPNDVITVGYLADVDLKNFILDFVIENSDNNPWSYVIGFRVSDFNNAYYLSINSDETWNLRINNAGVWSTIAQGNLENLDTNMNGSNDIHLTITDEIGYFYLNGQYIDSLDVSENFASGEIQISSANEILDRITRFKNLIIWDLP